VLDIVQPDLAICGGITEALRIAALADAFDVPVVPHVWGTGINFYAALQFTSVLAGKRGAAVAYPLFEYDFSPNPLRSAVGELAVGSDGMVAIPDAPGIGVEIRRETFADFIKNEWQVG
jgi:D-galactarolactone cycloisomerase